MGEKGGKLHSLSRQRTLILDENFLGVEKTRHEHCIAHIHRKKETIGFIILLDSMDEGLQIARNTSLGGQVQRERKMLCYLSTVLATRRSFCASSPSTRH
jgi:hypothetical protein